MGIAVVYTITSILIAHIALARCSVSAEWTRSPCQQSVYRVLLSWFGGKMVCRGSSDDGWSRRRLFGSRRCRLPEPGGQLRV